MINFFVQAFSVDSFPSDSPTLYLFYFSCRWLHKILLFFVFSCYYSKCLSLYLFATLTIPACLYYNICISLSRRSNWFFIFRFSSVNLFYSFKTDLFVCVPVSLSVCLPFYVLSASDTRVWDCCGILMRSCWWQKTISPEK